jgi:AraC family transcriptional regulator of adaptative response/methylated-DNA-[protein]-cysteine methyltransferase
MLIQHTTNSSATSILSSAHFDTPLGTMMAIANNTHLYLLEFTDRVKLHAEIQQLKTLTGSTIRSDASPITRMIESEIQAYFSGTLNQFKTPLMLLGTAFQKKCWNALLTIPHGETRSYADQENLIQQPSACRAVGHANSMNRIAIVVPCHRVIQKGGRTGGYAAGTDKKAWLIQHEKSMQPKKVAAR